MSHSSIGTGSGDSNENHGFDELPSKTMGAESGNGSIATDTDTSGRSTGGKADGGAASTGLTGSDPASPDAIPDTPPFANNGVDPGSTPR